MASKTDFKGYAEKFEKGGAILRDVTKEANCTSSVSGGRIVTQGCDDGTKGLYRQVWRKGEFKDRALYAIVGQCPKGHKVERYGFGELPPKDDLLSAITIKGVG